MDAVEFLKEWNRMCKNNSDSCWNCKDECEFMKNPFKKKDKQCWMYAMENPDEAVKFVEKWSSKHPQKTRLQDFKEKFPKSKIEYGNYEYICCEAVGYCEKCRWEYDPDYCEYCWHEPV